MLNEDCDFACGFVYRKHGADILARLKRNLWRKVRSVFVCVGEEVLSMNVESFPSGSHTEKTCR